LGILRHTQTKLKHKCVAEGSIISVDKGVQLFAKADVKHDTILFHVMLSSTNQYKTAISARCIIDTEDPSSSHTFAAATKHALTMVGDLTGSDLDPSMGVNKARIDRTVTVGDYIFRSPINRFG
jgi:hypothetical protein